MNRYQLLIIFLLSLCINTKGQVVTEDVSFDNYISTTNNDLVNHFNGGQGMNQLQVNGITGGCLSVPDSNLWGNDNARYCSKYKGVIGTAYNTSICFKYDSLLINSASYDRATSIWLQPQVDFNHYLIASVSHDKRIELITYAWTNYPGPLLSLLNNHWYKLALTSTFTGGGTGDQINVLAQVYDLGISGTNAPVLVNSSTGIIHDAILIADTAIQVSITGAHYGGTLLLDSFHYSGIKSADSCITTTGISNVVLNNNNFDYSIKNNSLIIKTNTPSTNTMIEIVNVSGQRIIERLLTDEVNTINVSTWLDGIYFLTFRSSQGNKTLKFVLSR